jgi:hypothetical protein
MTIGPGIGIAAAGSSRTVEGAGKYAPARSTSKHAVPDCSATSQGECHIDITLHQGSNRGVPAVCSSFNAGSGFCIGRTLGTREWSEPGYSPQYGIQSEFTWTSRGSVREIDYVAHANALKVTAEIKGSVPAPSSCELHVTDASIYGVATRWTTGKAGRCAAGSGPLFIDYHHPASGIGCSIHIYGYMKPK